ncbi:MAG: hypothetical protein CSA70_12185 [Rhodobacterales bacterium]|nr:MAG: hypothetical protein CSA70_12185 [Rhodobacterales bacterium]
MTAKASGWTTNLLALVWFAVHTFIGGPEVATQLSASELPLPVRAPAWMVWNMVTGLLLLMAGMLGWGTLKSKPDFLFAGAFMAATLAVTGVASAPLIGAPFSLLP